ncbi:hypothetical protein DW352_05230 [Pseudolabrys taiwanensis]|uniref:Uncharacterized protein n=1 Tax=Pseudolabrys taiwanensis TaxID=331696 RepID=A0A345ZSS5_9HYPH|nr:hypothetical protein [Pseudolabrys taiwanensis]AXK79972.1 hypothetical protein DW352_05230 [Pseudolabrys taiwanensis]
MSKRSDIMMANEGQLLVAASNWGKDATAEHARGIIDGCFNALVRFEGSEETAKFAFAVADRVAGALKTPTAWPLRADEQAASPTPGQTPPAPAPTLGPPSPTPVPTPSPLPPAPAAAASSDLDASAPVGGPGAVVMPTPAPPPRQYGYWTIFTIGWSLGVLVTAWITLSPFVARLLAGGAL